MKNPFHFYGFTLLLIISFIIILHPYEFLVNASETNKDKNKDSDGDGLTDLDEINIYKTAPKKADTDSDGINDGKEVNGWIWFLIEKQGFCDDLSNDVIPEGSNLKNLCIVQKTNPLLIDTDRDGNNDFFEYNFLLANALDGDQDNDGLVDGLEVGPNSKYRTSFLQIDTDGDGVSDGQEVTSGTDPLDPTDNPEASRKLTERDRLQNPLAGLPFPPRSTAINPPLVTPPLSTHSEPGNEPPRVFSQTLTIQKNRPIQVVLFATDPNGQDQLTFYIRSNPIQGQLGSQIMYVDRTTAKVLYTPAQNAIGRDIFTFWAFDGKEFSRDQGRITINILP
jgi:hypothetical protein